MKKILLVALILLTVILSACGNKKTAEQPAPDIVSKDRGVDKMIYASPEHSCSCIVELEDVDGFMELKNTLDREDLMAVYGLMVENDKILIVRENTKVACYYAEKRHGHIPVIFLEGEYKGRRAYVPEKRLQ